MILPNEIWRMKRRLNKDTTNYRKQVLTLQKDHPPDQVDVILDDAQNKLLALETNIAIAESDALVQEAYHLKVPVPSRADKGAWDDFFGPHVLKPEAYANLRSVEAARQSVPEDERPHPTVGAVVVKNGTVVSKAHRGENPKSRAEYIALEKKLPDDLPERPGE